MKFFRWLASPVPVLMILSPSIGELLSGSSPPIKFINPVGLVILILLYGVGAVLIRELIFRWKAGLLSLLILGAAYGIIEEGLMVKSFTDPNWPDLVSGLGFYGRWLDVNCVWAIGLTFYHAIFSITIPILIVGLIFPAWRQREWLGRKAFLIMLALFMLNGLVIFFQISRHTPPILPYIFFAAAVAGLILLAWRLAGVSSPGGAKTPARATRFKMWLTGFFTGWMVILATFGSRGVGLPPLAAIILQFTLIGGGLYGAYCLALNAGGFSDRIIFSMISGLMWVMILLTFVQELKKAERPEAIGMAVVGIAFAVGLWLIGRKLKKNRCAG